MRLRRFASILLLSYAIAVFLYSLTYAQSISPQDAHKYLGETRTVCGNVASTFYAVQSKGHPTFLNLEKPYPDQLFTIVIWGSERDNFDRPPEKLYKNKHICVTGIISSYRGTPQIIVKDPSQIKNNTD